MIRIPVVAGRTYRDWCSRCNTSARVRVNFYRLAWDHGPVRVGTYDKCQTCDVPDDDEEG